MNEQQEIKYTKKKYNCRGWLYIQYWLLDKSLGDIAKICSVSAPTILRKMQKYKIERRKWEKGNYDPKLLKKLSKIHLGEKNPQWKGKHVKYRGIHKWIRENYPHNNQCEKCHKKTNKIELANISGIYIRDRKHFRYLCCKCHRQLDRNSWIKYHISKEDLFNDYIMNHLTRYQLAEKYKCTKRVIDLRLKEFQIYKRGSR